MIRITLYKNCILSHDYNEVFHHEVFDDYLYGLAKKTYDLDTVYQENNGIFVFDYNIESGIIYDYNYMKVETFDENGVKQITRYCFIKDIRLKNDLVYLEYEEDIWQSYSKDLEIRDSYLSRSLALQYGNKNLALHNLPLEYNGNNALLYTPFYDDAHVVIFAQFQLYNTDKYGTATKRFNFFAPVIKTNVQTGKAEKVFSLYDLNYVINSLMTAVQTYQTQLWQINTSAQQDTNMYRIEVSNIYVIPYYFIEGSELDTLFPDEYSTQGIHDYTRVADYLYLLNTLNFTDPNQEIFFIPVVKNDNLSYNKNLLKEFSLENNFKNMSVGTLTNQIPIINNGLDRKLSLSYSYSEYNFNLYLEFDNKLIDITDDFLLDIPYTVLNSAELAQQRIERTMKNVNSVGKIASGAVDIGLAIGTAGASKTVMAGQKIPKNIKNAQRFLNAKESLINYRTISDTESGIGEITSGITGLISANQPLYSSSSGTFTKSLAILNAFWGLCFAQIDSSNDEEVEEMLKNTGYITYSIVGNEALNIRNDIPFNILQFDFVKAYGKFSQNICDKLKEILFNGFKIWYEFNV